MLVKRRDLIRYLEKNGFFFLREGGNHTMYSDGKITIPVKQHKILDRIYANETCKDAKLTPIF